MAEEMATMGQVVKGNSEGYGPAHKLLSTPLLVALPGIATDVYTHATRTHTYSTHTYTYTHTHTHTHARTHTHTHTHIHPTHTRAHALVRTRSARKGLKDGGERPDDG